MGQRKFMVIGLVGDTWDQSRWADSFHARDSDHAEELAHAQCEEAGDKLVVAGVVALSKTRTIKVVG